MSSNHRYKAADLRQKSLLKAIFRSKKRKLISNVYQKNTFYIPVLLFSSMYYSYYHDFYRARVTKMTSW